MTWRPSKIGNINSAQLNQLPHPQYKHNAHNLMAGGVLRIVRILRAQKKV